MTSHGLGMSFFFGIEPAPLILLQVFVKADLPRSTAQITLPSLAITVNLGISRTQYRPPLLPLR